MSMYARLQAAEKVLPDAYGRYSAISIFPKFIPVDRRTGNVITLDLLLNFEPEQPGSAQAELQLELSNGATVSLPPVPFVSAPEAQVAIAFNRLPIDISNIDWFSSRFRLVDQTDWVRLERFIFTDMSKHVSQ